MAQLPVPANTTCDVYVGGRTPAGGAPDTAGVSCYLEERFGNIKPTGAPLAQYTHKMRVPVTTDIRDSYAGGSGGCTVYVPNKTGTQFTVVAVARSGRGTSMDHKICYLVRVATPSWPTNDV